MTCKMTNDFSSSGSVEITKLSTDQRTKTPHCLQDYEQTSQIHKTTDNTDGESKAKAKLKINTLMESP